MNEIDYIYKRKSIRQFKDKQIPLGDLKKIIKAAGAAPSSTNSQNWFFVAIRDKKKILKIEKIILDKVNELNKMHIDDNIKLKIKRYLKYATLFKTAPTVIIVLAKDYNFLNPLDLNGLNEEDISIIKKTNPEMQNIGAAIENLCLSASSLGYGTCWMTAPCFAFNEINEYIKMDESDFRPVAIVPIGYKLNKVNPSPKKKDLSEIFKIL